MLRPVVRKRYDDFIATWPGDDRANVVFTIDGALVTITDVARGNQPSGSAGRMIAAALQVHGAPRPTRLRAMNVLDKQATHGRESAALLTDVLRRAARELGAAVTGQRRGIERGKVFVEIDLRL